MRAFPRSFAGAMLIALAGCGDVIAPEAPSTEAALASSPRGDRRAPTKPTNLRITSYTPSSVSLAWDPSTDESAFSYRIRHMWGYEVTVPSSQTSYVWTVALTPEVTHSWTVYAIDVHGNKSAASNSVSLFLPRDTQAPTPPALSVTAKGSTWVTLAWSSSDDSDHLFYTIYKDGVRTEVRDVTTTSGTFAFLQPSTTYTFTATARDKGNNVATSAPLTVTTNAPNTSDVTPPTTPTDLWPNVVDDSAREIWLSWTQSTDNADPQAALRYDVFLNGALVEVAFGVGRGIFYGVHGQNNITVVAVDGAGNKSAPATLTMVFP